MTNKSFNPKPKMGMNAHEVKFALHKMFPAPDWLAIEEFWIQGFDRYVDLWAMRIQTPGNWNKKWSARVGYLRIHAFEIKVSRPDFLNELKHPAKSLAGQSHSNYFSFAAPRGIIEPEEIPRGFGFLEFSGSKGKWLRDPIYTQVEPPRWELVAALGRSILKA